MLSCFSEYNSEKAILRDNLCRLRGCLLRGQKGLVRFGPSDQRDTLAKRLDVYLKANRSRDWKKLYELISDAGRGGANRQTFITRMASAHGRDFANDPDLLEFQPARTVDDGGYDIYCWGKAQREGRDFNGIALIHASF